MRIATFGAGLTRDGPGLLLRDLEGGDDPQIAAVVEVIAAADADVLLLTGIDWDFEGRALDALAARLAEAGVPYPHRFAGPPNTGLDPAPDRDGDGRTGTPDDAQGWGRFRGEGGMALLSRHPLGPVRDLTATLWRDLPGHLAPDDIAPDQRLATTARWDVPVTVGTATLHLLAWSATPPVFGTGDRNARRNHDELAIWATYDPGGPFVLLGNANLDPEDGDGLREAWARLRPRVTDPQPRSAGGAAAPNARGQRGDPGLDTADWPEDRASNLRVEVVLPSTDLTVADSGVLWPTPGDPLAETVATASPHRLVWVDLDLP